MGPDLAEQHLELRVSPASCTRGRTRTHTVTRAHARVHMDTCVDEVIKFHFIFTLIFDYLTREEIRRWRR